MPIDAYTQDPAVLDALARVQAACTAQDKHFSDVIDAEGRQYVDFVMEGGGVLGIALVGFTYVLERANIRFLGLGGTSAGSINALVLAAMGTPAAAKAERLIEVLADIPIESFIDGDADAQDFCRTMLAKKRPWKLAWKAMQVLDNLNDDLGLNPGAAFEQWLQQVLAAEGVAVYADIARRLQQQPAGIRHRDRTQPLALSERTGSLALVAADITTETKADFPRMAELYWDDPMAVPPAQFARASMSIPAFFHPMRRTLPRGREAQWASLAGYTGSLPADVLFVDGGIMSNFPIDLFHNNERVPAAPTFGVKIGRDRQSAKATASPGEFLGAIFDAARHTLDYDFIKRNPDYRFLVSEIDTGAHHWLDFGLGADAKVDLFRRGAQCAAAFLCKFDWDRYKAVRRGLVVAHQAGGTAKPAGQAPDPRQTER